MTMIEKILKKRGHSNPRAGVEKIIKFQGTGAYPNDDYIADIEVKGQWFKFGTTQMEDPFEMHRVIYKDPATVSKLAQSFRDDVQVDIGNIKQALSEEDSVEWSPDDLQIYIRKAQQIENDLRSGKEGSITAVNEFFKWSYQVFNAGWGGNIDFDDVFPSFSSTMASYLGKSYYPDEIKGL